MNKSLSKTELQPVVTTADGEAITSSTAVAEYFGKRHDDVLRTIRALRSKLPPDRLRIFAETIVERPNPKGKALIKSQAFTMNRDGFALLAMGFTGEKALAFKLAYLDAFNRMEATLKGAAPAPAALPDLDQLAACGDRVGKTLAFAGVKVPVHWVGELAYLSAHDLGRLLSGSQSNKPSPSARRHVLRAYELLAAQIPGPHVLVTSSPNGHDTQPQRLFSLAASMLIAQHCRLRGAQMFARLLQTYRRPPKPALPAPEEPRLAGSGWLIRIDHAGKEVVTRVPVTAHVATAEQFVEMLADSEHFLMAQPSLLARAIQVLSDRLGRVATFYKHSTERKAAQAPVAAG